MTPTGQIEIPLSKKKMVLTLIVAIVFVGLGLWFLISPPKTNHWLWGNPTFLFIAGLSSVIFFGFVAVLVAKKLPDNTAGLTINDEGIFDNSSSVSAGLVLWSDIKEIKVAQVMSQKFLMFIVHNPQDYIDRQTNTMKRKGMQMNLNSYGSPISISANTLTTNFDTLYELLQKKFDQKKS
ncbi:STM3941 family protein [Flectobacillus sp. DC10W]|uniref:STM3941 family protein n=1 Tax=Flectobacillus longus TaxID=2984207 RepID=A0ABT6YQ08_9BACT|nr:STM3941 family protein [Flectobacillus longus]MDI9865667.1 STM3941 family protein [Flectobacillus longus]